jgi:hypothetical protein
MIVEDLSGCLRAAGLAWPAVERRRIGDEVVGACPAMPAPRIIRSMRLRLWRSPQMRSSACTRAP